MADQPRLILQIPRGSAAARQLSADPLPSVANGDILVQIAPTDDRGNLEAETGGQIVLSVPSPETLERQAGEMRRLIGQAGTGAEPLVVVVEAAEELREVDLAGILDAADHTERAVIVRVIRST
jgi:hypothetical protein